MLAAMFFRITPVFGREQIESFKLADGVAGFAPSEIITCINMPPPIQQLWQVGWSPVGAVQLNAYE